jgi:hypothetical protein
MSTLNMLLVGLAISNALGLLGICLVLVAMVNTIQRRL